MWNLYDPELQKPTHMYCLLFRSFPDHIALITKGRIMKPFH